MKKKGGKEEGVTGWMVTSFSAPKTHDYVPGVIMEINKLSIGFVVGKVEEMPSIDTEDLSGPPKFGTKANTGFIKNTPRVENEVIMVPEPEKLFKAE